MVFIRLFCVLSAMACDVAHALAWLWTVLPSWAEAAAGCAALFYLTRLRKPAAEDVRALFGDRARCIGHRGALLDAPENTIAAFQYCNKNGCDFVEFDVRSCGDGELILLHDANASRLTGEESPTAAAVNWNSLNGLDVASVHPEKEKFGPTQISRFHDAVDYLLTNNMKMIIDIKGHDKVVIDGVVDAFKMRPELFRRAAVTTFNPMVLYQVRRREPRIVGAMSYQPLGLSYDHYDATLGHSQRSYVSPLYQAVARSTDAVLSLLWRAAADWCRVSAVFLHKDIVSPAEVAYWRERGVLTIGWSVNRPLEKLYWRGVLGASYLANTLVGEPPAAIGLTADKKTSTTMDVVLQGDRTNNTGTVIDELLREKSK